MRAPQHTNRCISAQYSACCPHLIADECSTMCFDADGLPPRIYRLYATESWIFDRSTITIGSKLVATCLTDSLRWSRSPMWIGFPKSSLPLTFVPCRHVVHPFGPFTDVSAGCFNGDSLPLTQAQYVFLSLRGCIALTLT